MTEQNEQGPRQPERRRPRGLEAFTQTSLLALQRFALSVTAAAGIGLGTGYAAQQTFRAWSGFDHAHLTRIDKSYQEREERRKDMTWPQKMKDRLKDSAESLKRTGNPLKSLAESQPARATEITLLRAVDFLDKGIGLIGFLWGFKASIGRVKSVVDRFLTRRRDLKEKDQIRRDLGIIAEGLLHMEAVITEIHDRLKTENRPPTDDEKETITSAARAFEEITASLPPELRAELEDIARS